MRTGPFPVQKVLWPYTTRGPTAKVLTPPHSTALTYSPRMPDTTHGVDWNTVDGATPWGPQGCPYSFSMGT